MRQQRGVGSGQLGDAPVAKLGEMAVARKLAAFQRLFEAGEFATDKGRPVEGNATYDRDILFTCEAS